VDYRILLGFLLLLTLISCDNNPEQKPLKVVWGRDIGEMSSMVISDPRYAAQIVKKNGSGKLFVEIGTAIQWLALHGEIKGAKIWVTDFNNHQWLEAEIANWKSGFKGSPMGFGFRAYKEKTAGALSFAEVSHQVLSKNNLKERNRKRYLKK
jgi:hypothetical protein